MEHAAAAVIIAAAVLLLARWWLVTHPFGTCRRCGGTGRNRFSTRWREGTCRRCGGSGQRPAIFGRTDKRK